ncbi:MAG: S8 family serine peptidase [Candidatus Eisenbacteria bacterium]|nr:S8 family serine peptidase [Candidatus Eisenbacteria bacterium]
MEATSGPNGPVASMNPTRQRISSHKYLPAAILIALLIGPGVGGAQAAPDDAAPAGAYVGAQLAQRLREAAPHELLPFTAMLREQADPRALRIEAGRRRAESGAQASRAQVIATLKALAGESQAPLLALLEAERRAGRVGRYEPLWIANLISGTATADLIRTLATRPEIARLVWDPPVRCDAQNDEVVPPGGRRYVPPREALSAPASGGSLARMRGDGREDPEIGWNLQMIGAPQAWDRGHTGEGVVVAIIDSGVDYTHPDLSDHLWYNSDEIPWNDEDDDFNGFVDDTLGWDFIFGDNDPMGTGPTDHGTRVAGLVAGDGTAGIATGVAPDAQIMSLKASGGAWSNVYAAIQYACDNGADVIAMSLSQKWHDGPKPDYAVWRQVSDNELATGMLHANSIGNEGDNIDTDPVPFNISAPGNAPPPWVSPEQFVSGGVSVIHAIGAVDSLEVLCDFSSRGPSAWEDVGASWPEYPYEIPPEYWDYPWSGGLGGLLRPDVLAPGEGVLATRQGGGYLSFSGTSASCPHGAGALAVLIGARGDLSPAQAALALQLGARDLGPLGKDNDYGAGIIDLTGALDVVDSLDVFAYVSGTVTGALSGDTLQSAVATILETGAADTTDVAGVYRLMTLPGSYAVELACFGYRTDTLEVSVAPGERRIEDVALTPWPSGQVGGLVVDEESGLPIPGARVEVVDTPIPPVLTGIDGAYAFPDFPADTVLAVRAVHFGHLWRDSLATVGDSQAVVLDLVLPHGVEDDFEVDQGWQAGDSTDTAAHGIWTRCDPNGIFDGGVWVQPEDDHTEDPGVTCFVTGNGVPGAGEHQNDVDRGITTLTSPLFDGSWFYEPFLKIAWWYSNDTGFYVDDTLRIEVSNDAGASWVTLLETTESNHAWQVLPAFLENVIELSDSMCVRIIAADTGSASSVEVAIDDFSISGAAYSPVAEERADWRLCFAGARPNPIRSGGMLAFTLERSREIRLELFDVSGRRVCLLAQGRFEPGAHEIAWNGTDDRGRRLGSGSYYARFSSGGEAATRQIILLP